MNYTQILHSMIRLAAPVLLIALGGIFSLKVNIFNLGLEAFALMGCFSAIAATYLTSNLLLGSLIGLIVTTVYSLIYGLFVIKLRVNAVICAIAFITLTSGLTRYLMRPIFGTSGKIILDNRFALETINIIFLDHIPFIGQIINNHTILVYVALIAPFLVNIFLYKTEAGLFIRSVGQNEEAAIAAGINSVKWKYISTMLTGFFTGLAGIQLAMSVNLFNVDMTAGRGFTALAVLIMTKSNPLLVLLGSLLFGLADAVSNTLSTEGYPPQFLGMLPYVLALIVVIVPSWIKYSQGKRRKRISLLNVMDR